MGQGVIEGCPTWVTTLGRGAKRASVAKRAAARAAKAEANQKMMDVGMRRRIGGLIRLFRYGDDILAEFRVLTDGK